MIDIVNAYNLLEEIELEESAKTDFIAKFGEETFNNFVKAKQRLANRGLSVDFGQYLKKSKEEVDNLILSLYDDEKDAQKKRALTGQTRNIRGKYKFLGEMDGYLVYNPLDHLASMDLGINTGWCTTGRYRHAGHPEFNPSEADAKQHFNSYTRNGCRFYYLLNPDTFYGEYALVFNSSTQADAYFEKHDDEVVYMYRKASQRISISSVYNAADMLVHSYPAEVKNIIQKIERTVNDDNSPEAKPEVMTTHKIINNFELDSDGVIMKF